MPIVAPRPFVIIINSPCAEERVSASVFWSTNKAPEILKKSNATPYTIQLSTSIQSPEPGSPAPNNPNLSIHANMAIIITFFIPNLLRQKGMRRIQHVSLICDREMRILACCAPNVSAYSATSLNDVINGLAYPFVICRLTPRSMEKMKNIAIFFFLNSRKESRPRA